ncbi:hypothetical protein HFO06_10930 [Rhizobium leguminosarum]|uniref:hypothetical protein n=1 Tax=Rhizobium leguminosarum TaxID=384 RepID=UPI001C938617|nr:hypothetical protein [Rhizobium leguminosarum]MBY5763603.1 hypothetical protein [Rhizobium leguminosarum]MBY5804113.1 hypothetical protein [Rhizobium leguminosarum]
MQIMPATTQAARAAVGRDIACEMASFMRAHPSCTYADLRAEGFTSRQIDRYQPEAKDLADRLSTRRVA